MPSFLDFVLSYGRHQHAQDFHFVGFRHESSLPSVQRGLRIPELGRSGRRIQLCYSFSSVEPSARQTSWPWSVRQTATYHSLDLESGHSTWIVVKGDQLMHERVISATKSPHVADLRSFRTLQDSVSSSFATHLIFCDWSAENWRWYINFLEDQVQDTTRRTVDIPVSKPLDQIPTITPLPTSLQGLSQKKAKPRPSRFSRKNIHRQHSTLSPSPAVLNVPTGPPEPPERPPEATLKKEDGHGGFSFKDLQRIQFIEEQANETLLVLKNNTNILTELTEHYSSVMQSEDCPQEIEQHCKGQFAHFGSRIVSVQHDLRMQQSRVETLLRILADRKTLLYGILQFRSMEATNVLAEKAQQSTGKMGLLTEKMHEVAIKTKQETVSMRIITLVTLFFLPGTFISTLMSTDIVRFPTANSAKPERVFCLDALKLFLAITLPLMCGTFMAGGLFYWITTLRERMRSSGGEAGAYDSRIS
ncbi:hypothetical protein EPUS_05427 [Endocarpon pusillum Z07020]|uniref:CorA-like transporter domain-containing protein n=1 Tax=Endocarpon pusillum (strain Z07020 / HMAS-L-300199) TaxID=1263415 RepID=U1HI61_ENDPU|nr:uncharacterized protein EPUS_05427 [Endocarpon pusillum Z07020]ERF69885.1 hypothetical protein EPUS_05427 [Endocarpon pusillum Z07020]